MWLCEKIGENLRYEDSYLKFWQIYLNEKEPAPEDASHKYGHKLLQIYEKILI